MKFTILMIFVGGFVGLIVTNVISQATGEKHYFIPGILIVIFAQVGRYIDNKNKD